MTPKALWRNRVLAAKKSAGLWCSESNTCEQANTSFNLTSPALRGGRHSGAVKRAPQVNSSPLAAFEHESFLAVLNVCAVAKQHFYLTVSGVVRGAWHFRISMFQQLP
jgi:hypothetical protein